MRARSTIAALAALAVTGCWPVIPGKADDYVIPETSLVTGTFAQTVPIGGYWETNDPAGAAYWGVFAEPQAITGVEFWGPVDTCTRNPDTFTPLVNLLRTGGSGTSRLLHDDAEVRLTWVDSARYFVKTLVPGDFVAATAYDLAPVEFADLGSFEIPEFMETPEGDLVVTSPAMDADTMPAISGPEALTITWDGKKSDYIGITAYVVSGGTVLEEVTCLVDDNGSFQVPADLFTATGDMDYLALVVAQINLQGGTANIGGVDQGYVTSSAYAIQGGVTFGTPAALP